MPPKRARKKPPDPIVGSKRKRPGRPDVALRMKDAKNWDQYVVKSSLQRILVEKSILPALQTLQCRVLRLGANSREEEPATMAYKERFKVQQVQMHKKHGRTI